MLRDLGRALSEAISDSSEVNETLRKIRREGYSLHLLLDCKRDNQEGEALPLGDTTSEVIDPRFQINAVDLSFLRSIGIDPTRRMRTPRFRRGSS